MGAWAARLSQETIAEGVFKPLLDKHDELSNHATIRKSRPNTTIHDFVSAERRHLSNPPLDLRKS